MTFSDQLIATFSGALLAFIFSIGLFYLTEKWKNGKINKDLNNNIQKESDYNLTFLEKQKAEITEAINDITINNRELHFISRFYKLQRLFILEAFNKGLLYRYLTSEEIADLDNMLIYFSNITDKILMDKVEKFKVGIINQKETLENLNYDKRQIDKYEKVIKDIKGKLSALK